MRVHPAQLRVGEVRQEPDVGREPSLEGPFERAVADDHQLLPQIAEGLHGGLDVLVRQ